MLKDSNVHVLPVIIFKAFSLLVHSCCMWLVCWFHRSFGVWQLPEASDWGYSSTMIFIESIGLIFLSIYLLINTVHLVLFSEMLRIHFDTHCKTLFNTIWTCWIAISGFLFEVHSHIIRFLNLDVMKCLLKSALRTDPWRVSSLT